MTLVDAERDVYNLIAELTKSHVHREHYVIQATVGGTRYSQANVVNTPSLLDQLGTLRSARGLDRTAGGYTSRPAANLDAIDALAEIHQQASAWLKRHDRDVAGTTKALLRRLGGLHPALTSCGRLYARRVAGNVVCCPRHGLEHDVRRWWTRARVMSGWDAPAWRPANSCPLCGRRGGLRVARPPDPAAVCTECGEVWSPERIGLLAEHIRAENREPDAGSVSDDST